MTAGARLRRLFGGAAHPDGQAPALQAIALEAAPTPPQTHRTTAHPQTIVTAALSQKVLYGWMQNRFQTRYPLALSLASQSPEAAGMIVGAVRYALDAVDADDADRLRAAGWLQRLGGTLGEAVAGELPLARLREAQVAVHAYAACAGALQQRTMVGRRFLSYLATRLGVPDEVARSLNRRYGG